MYTDIYTHTYSDDVCSGGADLWGKQAAEEPLKAPATDDGLLEIVGTTNPIHSLGIMAKVSRVCTHTVFVCICMYIYIYIYIYI
jgi:hypothetical protein